MNFNEYQKQAQATDKYPDAAIDIGAKSQWADENIIKKDESMLGMLYTLGLTGEAGEVADKMKKIFRDKRGNFSQEDILSIIKEVGDCMWYCSALANYFGWPLEKVAELNIDKLRVRSENNKIHGSGDNR